MKTLTQRLLNDFQREFPLNPEPFDRIARELDISTDNLLDYLRELQVSGCLLYTSPSPRDLN